MGCRRTAETSELVRVSVGADGRLRLGPGDGRGAWLCAPPAALECLDAAVRRRALERALRAAVASHEVRALRAKLEE